MRKKSTGTRDFRSLLKEIAMLMGYEVTRDLPLVDKEIETPICKMTAKAIAGKKMAIVPILRAGLGMGSTATPKRTSRWNTTANFRRISANGWSSWSTRCSPPAARRRTR